MRTFIAIDIETPELVSKLVNIQDYIKKTGAAMKMVEPENFHITLKFLGEISPSDVTVITDALKKALADAKIFEISLEGIGAFPTIAKPRVIWVGISTGKDFLKILVKKISHELLSIGIRGDNKEFHPHVTLARVKRFNRDLVRALEELGNIKIGSMIVKHVRLKKSVLTPQGPIYSTLVEIPLKDT
ncbi:MAG: RNA 2',3'-cyclic phosphodiesterase [Candidatus Njordarchaeales archaeon]